MNQATLFPLSLSRPLMLLLGATQFAVGAAVPDAEFLPVSYSSNQPHKKEMTQATEEDVIAGKYLLYSLDLEEEAYSTAGPDYKGQVYGLFCEIDMSAQKEDPSKVPFFMNFVKENKCSQEGNHIKLDLHDIVQKTRAHDSNTVDSTSKSIPPTAFFYHEGRCGSTLVSNSVAALDPKRTRVYSEPRPSMQALLACDKTRLHCNMDKAVNLFHDVVYMMGRTSHLVEDRLFFKLLPSSVLGMRVIKAAYPDTPWTFIYRDPVHVMVSNMKNKKEDGKKAPGPYCTEGMKNQAHSEYTHEIVARTGKIMANLTTEEYCAAYLATLTEAAMEEVALTDGGLAVNYADMPQVLLDTVFPDHLGLPVGEKEKAQVLDQFGVYSKRMKHSDPKEAKDDSLEKEEHASDHLKSAVSLFMQSSYEKLLVVNNQDDIAVFERKLTSPNIAVDSHDIDFEFNPSLQHQRRAQTSTTISKGTMCSSIQGQRICCQTAGVERSVTKWSTYFRAGPVSCLAFYNPCTKGAVKPFDGSGSYSFQANKPAEKKMFEVQATSLCPATPAPTPAPTPFVNRDQRSVYKALKRIYFKKKKWNWWGKSNNLRGN